MRGINIAIIVFALGVSGAFLGSVGITDTANIDPGPSLVTERDAVEDEAASDQNISNIGGDPAFFGVNVRTSGIIGGLFQLFSAIGPMMQSANIPTALAVGVGSMASVFGGGMLLAQWLRGFRAED